MIAWDLFTPASALIGGAILGGAAGTFALLNGRVAGISGMFGSLLEAGSNKAVALAFLLGIVLAPLAWRLAGELPAVQVSGHPALLLAAGLIVGIGTRLGSGCTSGHGVCGLARLSPRSLAATLAFMATGFATVFVARHLLGA